MKQKFQNLSLVIIMLISSFVSVSSINTIEAYSTENMPDCAFTSASPNLNCYLRGRFETASGWDAAAACYRTHKIYYSQNNRTYYFCSPRNDLTNKEVTVFVRWNSSASFYSILAYDESVRYNIRPLKPNLIEPKSLWELGPGTDSNYSAVNCSNSFTGEGCSVNFNYIMDDPDFYEYTRTKMQLRNSTSGEIKDFSEGILGSKTREINLRDGDWKWRGLTEDEFENSGWTSWREFKVDTTAPSIPNLQPENDFSKGLQNTIYSNISTDNLIGGVKYFFEASKASDFSIIEQTSGWIDSTEYTFANLEDDIEYYYRVKSKDKLENISDWSIYESSIQDNTAPNISDLNITEETISPKNHDGIKDTAFIEFKYTEKYLNNSKLSILNSSDEVIFETSFDDSSETDLEVNNNLEWDGKDLLNNFVADGAYRLQVISKDLAGNEGILTDKFIVVDNEPADVNISYPTNGAYFNQSEIEINGQTEQDADLVLLDNQTLDELIVALDNFGIFSVQRNLFLGRNVFQFETTDSLGNRITKIVEYFREEETPIIDSNIENGEEINDDTPLIQISTQDFGFIDEFNQTHISGINESSFNLEITSESGDLVLVNNGENMQPQLGNLTSECSGNDCNFKFQFINELNPDGYYKIVSNVKDKAGNESELLERNFTLDSNTYLQIESPVNNLQTNSSKINIYGKAEQESNLTIQLGDQEYFYSINSENDNVSDCAESELLGVGEICNFVIENFELNYSNTEQNIQNNLKFDLTDSIGNVLNDELILNVNLFDIELGIDTDLEYFSPNGDGQQDGVNFINLETDAQIQSWVIEIKNSDLIKVQELGGELNLPENIFWNGQDSNNNYVGDGTYTYQLKIITTDNIEFKTEAKEIHAVSEINEAVVITFPRNASYTTRGVTNVQGQAPSNSKIKVCLDVIGISGECNFEYYAESSENGSFSTVVPLYRFEADTTSQNIIKAFVIDDFGNQSDESNKVNIYSTINNPFNSVEIFPAFTGINNSSDYDLIQNKINNGEEITQEDINALKSVVFRSNVNQGTDRVKFSFSDYTNVSEIEGVNPNYIGYIDGQNKTRLYSQPLFSSSNCEFNNCTWDFYFPIPPVNGGLYEINFEGKLGEIVETISSPLTIDANIPTAPLILDINKIESGQVKDVSIFQNKYYSNISNLEITGISDPNAEVTLYDDTERELCTVQTNSIGIFTCQIELTANQETQVSVKATLGLNTVESIEPKFVIIDTKFPNLLSANNSEIKFDDHQNILLSEDKLWNKSGDSVEIKFESDEKLNYLITRDTDVNLEKCINALESYEIFGLELPIQNGRYNFHNLNQELTKSNGIFTISGNAVEGRYCISIEFEDLAGNKTIESLRFNIDNTQPDLPFIHTPDWGIFNGIKSELHKIAKGRIVPEFVHEEDEIQITGYAELGQYLKLYVNGGIVSTKKVNVGDLSECIKSEDKFGNEMEVDTTVDEVLIENKYQCPYVFNYEMKENGKGYLFQVKAVDLAGNETLVSEDELVYLDKSVPSNPEIYNVASESYSVTPEFLKNGEYTITKDLNVEIQTYSEPRSDSEAYLFNINGESNYKYNLVPDSGFLKSGFKLGTISDERNGCVRKIDGRRTGICEDGIYKSEFKLTDAAGNHSGTSFINIERDTVKPEIPNVEEPYICNVNDICIDISGEPKSTLVSNGIYLEKVSSSKSSQVLVSNWKENTQYQFEIQVSDIAGNLSNSVTKEIKTPVLGRGGSLLGSEDDVYGNSTGDSLVEDDHKLIAEAYISRNSLGEFELQRFDWIDKPRGPEITFTTTGFDNKTNIWGLNYYPDQLIGGVKIYDLDNKIFEETKESCNPYEDNNGLEFLLTPPLIGLIDFISCNHNGSTTREFKGYEEIKIEALKMKSAEDRFYVNGKILDKGSVFEHKEVNIDEVGRFNYKSGSNKLKAGQVLSIYGKYKFDFSLEGKNFIIPVQYSESEANEFIGFIDNYPEVNLDIIEAVSKPVYDSWMELYKNFKGGDYNYEVIFGDEIEIKRFVETLQSYPECIDSDMKLPWPAGIRYYVSQDQLNPGGSHDPSSFYNKYAIDFGIQVGGEVNASRGGKVVAAEYYYIDYVHGGNSPSYGSTVNRVVIDHLDGTYSSYLHLKHNSGDLQIGSTINKGDKVGEVGMTGHTGGPHLHYTTFVQPNNTFYGGSVPSSYSDESVCNNIYNGLPQYYNPVNGRRENFKSDNN